MRLNDKQIVIYDFETEGYYEDENRPIEVAAAIIKKDRSVVKFHKLIKPRKPISEKITEITGITNEILEKDGEDYVEVSKEFAQFFRKPTETIIVGHNIIRFDNLFLNDMFKRIGYPPIIEDNCFDTAGHYKGDKLGWQKFSNLSYAEYHTRVLDVRRKGLYYNLESACNYYGIKLDQGFHRAYADVYYTMQVFLKQLADEGLLTNDLKSLIR